MGSDDFCHDPGLNLKDCERICSRDPECKYFSYDDDLCYFQGDCVHDFTGYATFEKVETMECACASECEELVHYDSHAKGRYGTYLSKTSSIVTGTKQEILNECSQLCTDNYGFALGVAVTAGTPCTCVENELITYNPCPDSQPYLEFNPTYNMYWCYSDQGLGGSVCNLKFWFDASDHQWGTSQPDCTSENFIPPRPGVVAPLTEVQEIFFLVSLTKVFQK